MAQSLVDFVHIHDGGSTLTANHRSATTVDTATTTDIRVRSEVRRAAPEFGGRGFRRHAMLHIWSQAVWPDIGERTKTMTFNIWKEIVEEREHLIVKGVTASPTWLPPRLTLSTWLCRCPSASLRSQPLKARIGLEKNQNCCFGVRAIASNCQRYSL